MDWSSGILSNRDNWQSEDKYRPVYERHKESLEEFKRDREPEFRELQEDLWRVLW